MRPEFRNAWVWLEIDSALLRGNLLGDPTRRRFPVYVPPQYVCEPNRRFPLVVYLVGYGGWGAMKLTEEKAWDQPLWARLDTAMLSGVLEPAIVAFPDCFTRFGGSQYVDSPVTGPYASHVCDELIPLLDQTLRTQADRDRRAVMGKSSGGFGALHLAMTRPDTFGLCCATAADSLFELSTRHEFGKTLQAMEASGGPTAFVRDFFAGKPRHKHWMTAMMTLACAQAYSSNVDVPDIFADLPFDVDTCELVPDVWQRWLHADPVHACARHVDALKSLRLLYLDAGRSDEWCLNYGHRALSHRLVALGVAHQREEFDGGHMGIDHRIEVSLAKISQVLREI